MTTTTFPTTIAPVSPNAVDTAPIETPAAGVTSGTRPRLWVAGLAAGAVAAAATTALAVAAHAAGVPLTISGEAIPTLGYAQLTLVGAVLGILLARLARRFAHPRSMFVRTTVALTALSVVPDALVDASAASRLVLAATHVVAAAIIVPALARRLAR